MRGSTNILSRRASFGLPKSYAPVSRCANASVAAANGKKLRLPARFLGASVQDLVYFAASLAVASEATCNRPASDRRFGFDPGRAVVTALNLRGGIPG
jgi:hypothetical protein